LEKRSQLLPDEWNTFRDPSRPRMAPPRGGRSSFTELRRTTDKLLSFQTTVGQRFEHLAAKRDWRESWFKRNVRLCGASGSHSRLNGKALFFSKMRRKKYFGRFVNDFLPGADGKEKAFLRNEAKVGPSFYGRGSEGGAGRLSRWRRHGTVHPATAECCFIGGGGGS